MSTDGDIIARSRDDPAAFGILFDRHAATIHRYVARRTNATVADDVMAETFLVAFQRRSSFSIEYTNAAPWLFGIATNLLRHHHRHEVRTLRAMARIGQEPIASMDSAAALGDADARLDTRAALRDVGAALRRMPQSQRDTVLLHAWADLARTFYGDASVREAARRDYALSAQADDPDLTRAAGGQLGNGELGGAANSYATTAELPSLSREPSVLLDDLSARSDGADNSRSVKVMDQISTLLSSGLVDAELTATMYRTLALLPDVDITEEQTTLDGRAGAAIGVIDDADFAIHEVVIDLDEGLFLGIRTRQVDALATIPAGTTTWSTATTSSVVTSTP